MSAKTIFVFVGQLLFIQAVISQCVPRESKCACESSSYSANNGFRGLSNVGPFDNYFNFPLPAGYPLPTQPIGISVSADTLVIDGCLNAVGNLPFMSAVMVEGIVPSKGQVEANFACGDGNVGITSIGSLVAPGPAGFAPNYNAGFGVPAILNVNRPGGCACV